jgi:small-conductance mechanosensitive channel
MAKKLSKTQAAIIAGSKIGDKLYSNPTMNTHQRSINALVVNGHLTITDNRGAMAEYTIQDTPEVRAAIAAAQPAPALTEAIARQELIYQRLKQEIEDARVDETAEDDPRDAEIARLTRELADAQRENAALADALAGSIDAGDELRDRLVIAEAQVASANVQVAGMNVLIRWLRADLEDGERERDIRGDFLARVVSVAQKHGFQNNGWLDSIDFLDGSMSTFAREFNRVKADYEREAAGYEGLAEQLRNQQRELNAVKQGWNGYADAVSEERREQYAMITALLDGLDNISPIEALTRLLSFRRTYTQHAIPDPDDTALVDAIRQRDNGVRTSADDVLAMFADDDAATLGTEAGS